MNQKPTETRTPRTDAHQQRNIMTCGVGLISADFARQLETELAEALRIQSSTEQVWHGAEAELNKEREVSDQLRTENAELKRQVGELKATPSNVLHTVACVVEWQDCERERDTLKAQLAEAGNMALLEDLRRSAKSNEKDKERLDWLNAEYNMHHFSIKHFAQDAPDEFELRSAIDAAITATKEGQ